MDSPFVTAIVVSSIGLVALCLALTVLFGLMYLLTLLKDRPAEEEPATQPEFRPRPHSKPQRPPSRWHAPRWKPRRRRHPQKRPATGGPSITSAN
jgi:hypothetical protein